jgi:hypothetical protein
VARSRDGGFYIRQSGDGEDQELYLNSAAEFVSLVETLETPSLLEFSSALRGIRGFKTVVEKLSEAERERSRAERQREIEALEYVLAATKPERNGVDYVDWWRKVEILFERLKHLRKR